MPAKKTPPSLTIVIRKIQDLRFSEYNPRQLTSEQFEQIKTSLETFGFVDPVIVNTHSKRKNIIIGGHQRVKVATEIGITEIPTVEVKLPLEKEKELNIRLNKNTGDWDWDQLANAFDMEELVDWGFSDSELTDFFDKEPGFSDPNVDENKLGKAGDNIDGATKRVLKQEEVMCPKCGHEFIIDQE